MKKIIDEINTALRNISLDFNFSSQIVNVELQAGVETEISHGLKKTPKYRIILRQSGSLIVSDGTTPWSDTNIYLKATDVGSGEAKMTVTVCILRG